MSATTYTFSSMASDPFPSASSQSNFDKEFEQNKNDINNNINNTKKAISVGIIIAIVIASLYAIFQITVLTILAIRIVRRRRRQRKLAESGKKSPEDSLIGDIEMAPLAHSETNDSTGPAQLPTNDGGGEDLTGRSTLEFQGNPVYQLHSIDQPRGPVELSNSQRIPETSRNQEKGVTRTIWMTRDSTSGDRAQMTQIERTS